MSVAGGNGCRIAGIVISKHQTMKKEQEKKQQRTREKVQAKVAGAISSWINGMQDRWVLFMQRCTGKASVKKQKAVFLTATALGASFCLYLVLNGIFGSPGPLKMIAPVTPVRLYEDTLAARARADTSLRIFLRDFYRQRDSLKVHAPEEWRWLVENRPGLIDSIARIEALVGEQ